MIRGGCVYIMVNVHHTVFYTGVTADLYTRITEHKEKIHRYSFTAKYNIFKLVYFESFISIEEAIEKGKKILAESK